MSPADFQRRLQQIRQELPDFFHRFVPTIIGHTAVSFFKRTFQKEAWDRQHWTEVKRLHPSNNPFDVPIINSSIPYSLPFCQHWVVFPSLKSF
ncbi:MAG: hypothetical protein MJZ77_03005 [Bacteroidales bacterium]|nr:hypothetical protein [Bacteroidales bacterium]